MSLSDLTTDLTSIFNLTLTTCKRSPNMRFNHLCHVMNKCKMCFKPKVLPLGYCHIKFNNYYKCAISHHRFVSTSTPQTSRISQDDTNFEDEAVDFEDNATNVPYVEGYARNLLFEDTKDLLLQRISSCASVEEVFKILETSSKHYDCEHVTQTVFVLYDLLMVYQDFSTANLKSSPNPSQEFLKELKEHISFQTLVKLFENKIHCFDHHLLSYCVFYLNKLGLHVKTPIMQLLCENLKTMLLDEFSIHSCARFLQTVFSEESLQSYFISQELVPLVFREIDLCTTAEALNHISISLIKLHRVVTDDTLDQFKSKVKNLIENGSLTSSDYKIVLQAILFLNFPKWRHKNTILISKCILLMQKHISDLTIDELLVLYEIFYKTQEPAHILNDLQRCSYRHFYTLDNLPMAKRISLFATIIFFTAPHVRSEFQKRLKQYVLECEDTESLLLLRKLLSQLKISDVSVCHLYWDKVLNILKNDSSIDALKLIEHYINFNADVDNYRHPAFEEEMFKVLNKLATEDYQFFPQKLASILNFTLLYGTDMNLLDYLMLKLESNWQQLKVTTCLKIAYTLRQFGEMKKDYQKTLHVRRIDKILDKFIYKMSETHQKEWDNNYLIKSCIYKNRVDSNVIDNLLLDYKNRQNICSKSIETIFYSFLVTNTLVPEILDNVTEYILEHKDHVLGFNVARVIYLCFCLGFRPQKSEELCETAVDILIRDFERLTGLSILYSSLALCFFNKLPNSLVKSIFNVEFMDKLDKELQLCYFKDKYPQRVRNYLMQLNRAVCLDYPECNVPWFHQKYVDETVGEKKMRRTLFFTKVKECLLQMIPQKNAVSENVITPYGYEVDFVLNLDSHNQISTEESDFKKRVALLLIPEHAYTNKVPKLKGTFQLKRRHLEILGYKVVLLKFSDWISLYHTEERIHYLKQLIFSNKFSGTNIQICR